MPKLAPCPPIVPPPFEPTAATRDALERAERARDEAVKAAGVASDQARAARAAMATAELAFASEDTNDRWMQFESARRGETSAALRSKRCEEDVATTGAALQAARDALAAEKLAYAEARASSLRLVENMRKPIARVAAAFVELLRARDEMRAAETEYLSAHYALNSTRASPPPPMTGITLLLAQYAAGVAALEVGGVKSPLSEGVTIGANEVDIAMLLAARHRVGNVITAEADALLRAIALEAIR